MSVVDDFGDTGNGRCDHRQAARQRLDEAQTERIGGDVRLAIDVGRREQLRDVIALPEKAYARRKPERVGCQVKLPQQRFLLGSLGAADDPRFPVGRPQFGERIEQLQMSLACLDPRGEDDYDCPFCGIERGAHHPAALGRGRPKSKRRMLNHPRHRIESRSRVLEGVAAVAQHERRHSARRPRFEPSRARLRRVQPPDERHLRIRDRPPEDRLRPRGVDDGDIPRVPVEHRAKSAARGAHFVEPAYADRRQLVHVRLGRPQRGGDGAVEAQGEARLERRPAGALRRERQHHPLDAAEDVAAVDV